LIPAPRGIPDPEGAAILIEAANRVASNPFKIDVGQLRTQAVQLKNEMQQLINAMQKQQQEASRDGSGPEIYS
jgi:predicted ATP-grasp superfamily ATP-dependent carboligase